MRPFQVVERQQKYFAIIRNGKQGTVFIQRIKPTYLDLTTSNGTAEHTSSTGTDMQQPVQQTKTHKNIATKSSRKVI